MTWDYLMVLISFKKRLRAGKVMFEELERNSSTSGGRDIKRQRKTKLSSEQSNQKCGYIDVGALSDPDIVVGTFSIGGAATGARVMIDVGALSVGVDGIAGVFWFATAGFLVDVLVADCDVFTASGETVNISFENPCL